MFVPDEKQFKKEVAAFDESVQTRLYELYEHIIGVIKLKSPHKHAMSVLSDIFSTKYSDDVYIPIKFLDTAAGKVIFTVLFGLGENIYTVNDIVRMTVSKSRPKGLSPAWIHKEIKAGNLKGTFQGGIWTFTQSQVDEYFELRGYKNSN